MSVLAKFGVSAEALADISAGYKYPPAVQGRVVHIDADFMAYQVSAESKDELDPSHPKPRKSLQDMQHNARVAVEHIMRLGGGTDYHVHTTPSGSNKGGRSDQVLLKEYQANRKDSADKPEYLDVIRAFIVSDIGRGGKGTAHLDQEADDGMAQAAWNAKDPNLVVIASADKDLRMVPGWHLIKDELVKADDEFGSIWLDDSGSAKKCVGLGTKFFWAQCIMGDTADNISGLPRVAGIDYMKYKPTAAYTKDAAKLAACSPERPDMISMYQGKLDVHHRMTKTCGQVMAYDLLHDAVDDAECYRRVRGFWTNLAATGYEFENWRTGAPVTATQALLGDMQALWMRRNKDPKDVVKWLREKMA